MLVLRRLPFDRPELTDVGGIIVSSANATSGIDQKMLTMPVFVVGGATAKAVREAGCQNVHVAGGDGAETVALIRKTLKPEAGAILHICGEDVRENVGELLAEAGFRYERLVVYRADAATSLSSRTIAALRSGELGAALFYSPRTAAIFADLVAHQEMSPYLSTVTAICLSPAVAERVEDLPWRRVMSAERRDQSALLDCVAYAEDELIASRADQQPG